MKAPPATSRPRTTHHPRSARSSPRRPLRALAAGVAIAAAVGACGSTTSTSRSRPPSAGASAASEPQAYANCMRAHGVANFPNPVSGHITLTPASGIDSGSPTFQAASQACASLGPSGPTPSTAAAGDPAPSTTQPTAATWRSFGAWLRQRAAAGKFSGALLVARNRTHILKAGYGIADRNPGIPNTAETKFSIASIGKLFTAVAIAQLAEQHKLAFNDAIGRYLTGLPTPIADHVTIAELLTMTSGLNDVALSLPNPPTTIAGMVKLIEKEPLRFNPGSRFLYSNDGYILLGAIIQQATGQSYNSYLRQHIFKPAGMTHTDADIYTPATIPGMAHGYMLVGPDGKPLSPGAPPATGSASQPTSLRDNSAMPQIANPSGGAYSTVGDLLKFAQALLDHKLLTGAMTNTVLTPRVNSPQPGGPPVDKYTYGFAYQSINGVTFVGHNGGTPGYEGQIDIYPQTHYVVVILTNQDQTMVPAIRKAEAILTTSK